MHTARSILRTCPLACKGERPRHTLFLERVSPSAPLVPVPSHAAPTGIPSFLSSHATPAVPFVSLADEARSPVRPLLTPHLAPPTTGPSPSRFISLSLPLVPRASRVLSPPLQRPVVLLSCCLLFRWRARSEAPPPSSVPCVLHLAPLAAMSSDPVLTPCNKTCEPASSPPSRPPSPFVHHIA